jgi:hypothetical protein
VSEFNSTTSLDPEKQGTSSREYTGHEAFALAHSTFSNLDIFQNSFTQHNGFWSHVGQMLGKETFNVLMGTGKMIGGLAGAAGSGTSAAAGNPLAYGGVVGSWATTRSGVKDIQDAAMSPSIKDNSHAGPTLMPIPR